MKQIPTLYSNYQELMLDLDIFGKIISTPQQSIQEMKNALFEEFKLRKPLPTLTDKRYELSEQVSQDYKIAYNRELEMQDYESLIDLESKSDLIKDFSFEDLTPLVPEVKALFSYEQNIKDADRKSIIEKYSMETGELFEKGVAQTEEIFNSVKEDKSLVLSDDEINNLGKSIDDDVEFELDEDDGVEVELDEDDDVEVELDEDDGVEVELDEDDLEDEEEIEDDSDILDNYEDDLDDDYPDEEEVEDDSDTNDYDSEDEQEDEDFEDDLDDDYPDEVDFNNSDDETLEEDYVDEFDDYSDEEEFIDESDEEDDVDESDEEDEVETNDNDDFEMEFDDEIIPDESPPVSRQINIPITPVEINSNIVKEEVIDRSLEPTDIRQFLRKHPRSDYDFVLKYFTKKQINDALRIGKIIKKGSILKLP